MIIWGGNEFQRALSTGYSTSAQFNDENIGPAFSTIIQRDIGRLLINETLNKTELSRWYTAVSRFVENHRNFFKAGTIFEPKGNKVNTYIK